MALTGFNQASEAVKRAKRTLIITPPEASLDAVSTAAGFYAFLKNSNIPAELYIPGRDINKLPSFLPSRDAMQNQLAGTRNLRLSIDVKDIPIHELSYDVTDGRLDILLTPKSGEWLSRHVSVHPEQDRFDLILAIGFADRNELSRALSLHSDFAHRVPVINLDNDPKNEHWSSINLVDLTAGSVSEVAFRWLSEWDKTRIDDGVATALLAGLIANTNSFKNANVTPLMLESASVLIGMGANREAIVNQFWRTRSVSTLKLWGRALSRLESDPDRGHYWTMLTRDDIVESGATEARLDELVNELIAYAPAAKFITLFVEHDPSTTRVAIFAIPPHDARVPGRLLGLDGSTGTNPANCRCDPNILSRCARA